MIQDIINEREKRRELLGDQQISSLNPLNFDLPPPFFPLFPQSLKQANMGASEVQNEETNITI